MSRSERCGNLLGLAGIAAGWAFSWPGFRTAWLDGHVTPGEAVLEVVLSIGPAAWLLANILTRSRRAS